MKHILNNLSEEEKNAIREQHTGGMKVMTENFSKLINSKLGDSKPLVKEQYDENDLDFLKKKHGIKFRNDFEGDDDEFTDYLYDNKGTYDNFIKDYKGNKEFTDDDTLYEPTDDDIYQLKQKHGIKFRNDFEGDDDEFTDYLYDNKDSFDNFKKDFIKLK